MLAARFETFLAVYEVSRIKAKRRLVLTQEKNSMQVSILLYCPNFGHCLILSFWSDTPHNGGIATATGREYQTVIISNATGKLSNSRRNCAAVSASSALRQPKENRLVCA